MTLTPTRPVADANSPEQQRLEVELLLGEPCCARGNWSGPTGAAGGEPAGERDRWRELGCLPLQREGQTLQVAIPTHWGPSSQQSLVEELAGAGHRLPEPGPGHGPGGAAGGCRHGPGPGGGNRDEPSAVEEAGALMDGLEAIERGLGRRKTNSTRRRAPPSRAP